MALILNIETSTKICSIAIGENGKTLDFKDINEENFSHAEKLNLLIINLLRENNLKLSDLNAIAISQGPGSYTGLRIGVSAAKGLCFAFDKPLISIDTLTSLSYSISFSSGYIVPMLDARRMEVYSAVFNHNHENIREIKAEIIDENSFSEYLDANKVFFVGDGAQKCKEIITHKNAVFVDDKFPSAKEMAKLSYNKHKKNDIENVAYFEPFYLKDFVVIPQKKKKPIY